MDPHSDRVEGFHLFLQPEGAAFDTLQDLIKSLAGEFNGPVFPPHVTLLSGIPAGSDEDVIAKAAQLAGTLEPFRVTLEAPDMEDAYFRALYLHAQESAELSAAHARALGTFALEDASPYVPHLSVLYGNYPEERKRAAVAALPASGTMAFDVDRVYVYRTEGTAEQWKKIAELPFGTDGRR